MEPAIVDRPTPATGPPTEADLAPTYFIDHEDPTIRGWVARSVPDAASEAEAARALFASVRDGIRYDPYEMPEAPEGYRASRVLAEARAYCVPKSVLLAAGARAAGIPARLGFSDVKNHLQSERLLERMGTDLFAYHGYTALWVGGQWLKASSAFNTELCARFGVEPLDFDGTSDALLHQFSGDGSRYMEYIRDHGEFTDLPLDFLLSEFARLYPEL